ncbi:hypothetical protein Tco_0064954 [Tanacetum coccineum]
MSPGTKLGNHIDEFNKLILDLANIDIEIEDEDLTLMLLTSLPLSYKTYVETLLYVSHPQIGSRQKKCPGHDVIHISSTKHRKRPLKGLWQMKLRALMVQQGCDVALETLPVDIEADEKGTLMKKAYSARFYAWETGFYGKLPRKQLLR